jgi:hypothetical protein
MQWRAPELLALKFIETLHLKEKTYACNSHETLTWAAKHEILDITLSFHGGIGRRPASVSCRRA